MNLATGIEVTEEQTSILATDETGALLRYGLDELRERGLPAGGSVVRFDTSFDTWTPGSFEEFAYAVGVPVSASMHRVWTFTDGSRRFIVPALALLRALLPKKVLLSRVFQSQSLDDLCTFDPTRHSPGVRLERIVGGLALRQNQLLAARLSWFVCFASSMATWNSVLDFARAGELNLLLPRATVSGVFEAVLLGNNAYVTRMNVSALEPNEEPLDFARGHARTIQLAPNKFVAQAARHDEQSLHIPTRDGSIALSDHEWALVREILNSKRVKRSTSRATVDGVLLKLSSSAPWKEVEYPRGTSAHRAVIAYKRWLEDGRLAQVLDVLRVLRSEGA